MIFPMSGEEVLKRYNRFLTIQQRNEIIKLKNVYYLGKLETHSDTDSIFGDTKSRLSSSLQVVQETEGFPSLAMGD